MSAKNNSDTQYYGRDLVTWCNVSNVCNMSSQNNSDNEYYGRDLVTWCNVVTCRQKIIVIVNIVGDLVTYGPTTATVNPGKNFKF